MLEAVLVLLVLGVLLGILLGFASIYLAVEEDQRVTTITGMLPGFNCGACGFPGCVGLANALVEKEVKDPSVCKPSNQEVRDKIKEYLANNL